MSNPREYIELTAVLVPDKRTGDFSAFFAQIPDAIAQGRTENDAINNLVELIKLMMQEKKDETLSQYVDHFEYKTKPYKLVHA